MFCRYYNNYDECAEDNLATFAVAPSRERGLKFTIQKQGLHLNHVAPSRERGLKSLTSVGAAYGVSRSFAGAWIEIESSGSAGQPDKGRSFAGAWIEIPIVSDRTFRQVSLLRGSVD